MSQIPGLEGGLIVNQKGTEQEQPHMAFQALGKLHKGRLPPPILKTVRAWILACYLFFCPRQETLKTQLFLCVCLCVCVCILNMAVDQTV